MKMREVALKSQRETDRWQFGAGKERKKYSETVVGMKTDKKELKIKFSKKDFQKKNFQKKIFK